MPSSTVAHAHLRRNRPMRGSHPAVISREPQTGARPAPLPIRNPGLHTLALPAAKRRMLSQKRLCDAAAAGGGVANGAGYQRTLQRIKMRQQRGNLGQEGV